MDKVETLYADDTLIIANKPSGLLSVPGRGPDKQDCLVRRIQQDHPTARIVHRLDCATSGLMVLAQTADAHRELSRQFHDREVDKAYVALVFGQLEEDQGKVTLPLMTDWPNRPKQMVSDEGKAAHTDYQVLERLNDRTRVRLTPVTGRTHQLRVHMMSLGNPILGDNLYATGSALAASTRLMLHAWKLGITHPDTGERLTFAPEPPF